MPVELSKTSKAAESSSSPNVFVNVRKGPSARGNVPVPSHKLDNGTHHLLQIYCCLA